MNCGSTLSREETRFAWVPQTNCSRKVALAKSGKKSQAKKIVWRMTAAAPHGEYVDLAATQAVDGDPSSANVKGWASSSFDLAAGLDVVELEDSMLENHIDDLFKKIPD
jgi:hypothetical protein